MKINLIEIGLIIFCILLLGLVGINFILVNSLGEENAALTSKLVQTQEDLSDAEETIASQGNQIKSLKSELDSESVRLENRMDSDFFVLSGEINATKEKISIIEEDFETFQSQYVNLQADYEEKVEEYSALMGQMEDFEADLQEKMYWYSQNADFGGETKGFLSRIETKCIDGRTLSMPCVAIVLENRSFEYISEGSDHIKSLGEFEQDGGGDCEDWSIFVKAIINEMAEEEGVNELAVLDPYSVGYMEVYEDDGVTYYYENDPKYLKIENLSVGCFPMVGGYGHCALLSENVLFEPQDGAFMANAYWEEGEYLLEGGGFVEVVIDDEDIHVQGPGGEWVSYAYFIEKIEKIIE